MGDTQPTRLEMLGSPGLATLTAGALSAAAFELPLPLMLTGAAGVGGMLLGGALAAEKDLSAAGVIYRAVVWGSPGLAATYAALAEAHPALVGSPWSWTFAASIAGGGAAMSVIGRLVAKWERAHAGLPRGVDCPEAKDPLRLEWKNRLEKYGFKGATVPDIRWWANGYGYDVFVDDLGECRKKWRDLIPYQPHFAAHAKLEPGCGVEALKGPHQGAAVLAVATRDALAETCDFPRDFSVTTIADPIRIGRYRNSDPVMIDVRHARTILVGPPDAGKTNQLKTKTGQILRSDDALIRMIDLNGGGLAWPWLRPWLAGRTKRPIIDWVGPDDVEAAKLAADTLWECKRRKREYDHLLASGGDDKLPVGDGRGSNPPPAIVLMVDEGAETGGQAGSKAAKQAAADIAEIRRIGRAVNVTVIDCYLRATSAMTGATANKKLSSNRILMQVGINDGDEGVHIFGRMVNPEDAAHQGCGWVATRLDAQRPFRGDRTVGQVVEDIVMACTDRRPEVFPSPSYAGRWERIAMPGKPAGDVPAPPPAAAAGRSSSLLAQGQALLTRMKDRSARVKAVGPHDRELAEKFEDVVQGIELKMPSHDEPLADEPDVPDAALKIRMMVEEIGRAQARGGIQWEQLQARLEKRGVSAPKATLFRWLKVARDDGLIRSDNGVYFPKR